MAQVAVVRAKGDGGLQDPQNGTYISSKRDTIVDYTAWVENLVNHDKVNLVDGPFDGSNWAEFQGHVATADGDIEKALVEYKKNLPAGNAKAEKVTVVASPQELDEKNEVTRASTRGPGVKTPPKED